MISVGSLTLVHFVEQQLEGWTFDRAHWPLHITLVPWFTVEDEEAVLRSLDRMAGDTKSLRLGVGGQDMFGPNKDVPVNIINNKVSMRALHKILVDTLSEADSSYHEDQYMGSRYVAHITRHEADGRHANQGEEVLLLNFHLVRLIDESTCRVEQQFELKQV